MAARTDQKWSTALIRRMARLADQEMSTAQIAKALGASVAATASTRNHGFLRELGADEVIDYAKEKIDDKLSGYDIVLDGVGQSVWSSSFRVLKRGGRLLTLTPPVPEAPSGRIKFFATATASMAPAMVRAAFTGRKFALLSIKPRGGDLEKINALIEAGKVHPVIEKVFPLEEIADAHRLSEAGHVRGKIVVRISN